MDERFTYAETRQQIIDMLRTDLLGPRSEDEVLRENPRYSYSVGMLVPQTDSDLHRSEAGEQEIDGDTAIDGEDYTEGKDDENEPVTTSNISMPSSVGISFYVASSTSEISIDASWGDYTKTSVTDHDKEGKELKVTAYARHPMHETIDIDFSLFDRNKDYCLTADPNLWLHVTKIVLKNEYSLVSVYLINRRNVPESDVESTMFQVKLRAYSKDRQRIFIAEHICRKIVAADEFYYSQRPIFGRGRGCAAVWDKPEDGKSAWVESEFIPEYEFPGVSAALEGFDQYYFSMRIMSRPENKDEIMKRLNVLADSYERWITRTLVEDSRMSDTEFAAKIGNHVIQKCREALSRIRDGIDLLIHDDLSFDAFCFMNRCMILQSHIAKYSVKHGSGVQCSFRDFLDPKDPNNDFGWRPFQIAFILMNLHAIIDPSYRDRETVDLLYFPTGGGKTEAYLGLMAFTIAGRRLKAKEDDPFNRDGGVTVILRYTLRLLTTQQRDRITKMVIAAEMIRKKAEPKYGREPVSIGFWVGGSVTPNKFEDLKEDPENQEKTMHAKAQKRMLYKQLLTCPFCGNPLKEDDYYIDTEKHSVKIYCSDPNCMFYKYGRQKTSIPVYLVDEEIYARCPTIILSTVDKFARLPWSPDVNALFGRVDRLCSRDGYVAIGAEHKKHRKTSELPASTLTNIRPFLPPELIVQDELHLITGPLGTVYGAYETMIEKLCTYTDAQGRTIKPKYVVSTATIKNAEEQAKCLYARTNTAQFPPNGFEIGDSYFIREIPVEKSPFRRYVGICAPGLSMKTILLRVYAVILQEAYCLYLQADFDHKKYVDPYYTLVGYFNSIRELGGTVRLLQDDIPDRIKRIQKKYGMSKRRFLSRREEITSRMSSYRIPEKLKQLEIPCTSKECLDTAIATNMIAVGMDVKRLGLMVVMGQPKQNSEYIQATSRIGREYPGLVFTIYNAYRPRDLSHYENFTGYHEQLYRFVEGTTATPFSDRARDRVMHALIISAIRLLYPEMAPNDGAAHIGELTQEQTDSVKKIILDRLNIVKPSVRSDAENEIDTFIAEWKLLASQEKGLRYYVIKTDKYNRLMNNYGDYCTDAEKPTLRSMREVESTAGMFYYDDSED